jgi:hypothetical protein
MATLAQPFDPAILADEFTPPSQDAVESPSVAEAAQAFIDRLPPEARSMISFSDAIEVVKEPARSTAMRDMLLVLDLWTETFEAQVLRRRKST